MYAQTKVDQTQNVTKSAPLPASVGETVDANTPGVKFGEIGDVLMTVSGGHVVPFSWKVTSARCIQSEPTSTENCRPIAG